MLHFDKKVTNRGRNDELQIRLGGRSLGSFGVGSTDDRFIRTSVVVPPDLRGTVQTFEFRLRDSKGGPISSALRLRSIHFG